MDLFSHRHNTSILSARHDSSADMIVYTPGVKDVLDCAGMKTAFGCAAPIGYVAEEDAYLVRQLRKQGAIIVGKTVTCELAGGNPSRTKNPRSPLVTPWGLE